MMTAERAEQLGLAPRARIVDTCLVGVDPVLMLTGPIDATQRLFERTGLGVDDIDVAEINEAFASVVLAWQKELGFSRRADQPQRRRHRPRPPARRHRRRAAHQGPPRAGAHRRPLRPRVDVLRWRPRHRHDHRAPVGTLARRAPRPTSRRSAGAVPCRVTPSCRSPCCWPLARVRRRRDAAEREPAPRGHGPGRPARRRRHDRRRHRRRRGVGAVHRHRHAGVGGPGPPGGVLRPEAKERTAELLPAGTLVRLERDVEARDRYDRLLAYVIRDEDDIFVNRLLVEEGFAESIAYPPNTTRQGELDQAEAERPRRSGGACGPPAAAPTYRSRPGSVGRRDVTRRAPGLRARRSPADHQLRRPRLVPRRQRRHLRGAARRHRHQRHADGPVPLGARRGVPLPRRGRRRAPHPQRRARPLPLGADHPRARRCSTATAASPARSPTCGTTPTSTRCAASSGPRWSGRSCGAST